MARTLLAAALGALTACSGGSKGSGGDGDSGGGDTALLDTFYSCHVAAAFQCQENNASPFGECADEGGVAGDGCPTEGLYGVCRVAQGAGGFELNVYIYQGWEAVLDDPPEQQCAELVGVWQPA